MHFFTKYSTSKIFFLGGGRGARVSEYFTKDPNLKKNFFWGGGGGGSGGGGNVNSFN